MAFCLLAKGPILRRPARRRQDGLRRGDTTDGGSRLEPALGAISMGALLQKAARRQHGLAIIDAASLLGRAHAVGVLASSWRGVAGKQPLPDEEVRECSVEAALVSRPKGPYVIRIRRRGR